MQSTTTTTTATSVIDDDDESVNLTRSTLLLKRFNQPQCKIDPESTTRTNVLWTLDDLPDELLQLSFTFVGIHGIMCSVSRVCRRWKRLCSNSVIVIDLSDFARAFVHSALMYNAYAYHKCNDQYKLIKKDHSSNPDTPKGITSGDHIQSMDNLIRHIVCEFCGDEVMRVDFSYHRCSEEVTDASIFHLRNLTNIKSLDLSNCTKISGSTFRWLKCSRLESLNLQGCDLMRAEVTESEEDGTRAIIFHRFLRRLPRHLTSNLKHLNLSRCLNLNDSLLERDLPLLAGALSPPPHLESDSPRCINSISDPPPNEEDHYYNNNVLESLNLSECMLLSNIAPVRLFRNLRCLDLHNNHNLTDEGLEAALRAVTMLERLDLSFCERITDRVLSFVYRHPHLHELNLAGCVQLTDEAFSMYIRHMVMSRHHQSLRLLNVSGCQCLTDAAMEYLSSGGEQENPDHSDHPQQAHPHLEELNLSGCRLITDLGLRHLSRLPNLTTLVVAQLPYITDNGLYNFISSSVSSSNPSSPSSSSSSMLVLSQSTSISTSTRFSFSTTTTTTTCSSSTTAPDAAAETNNKHVHTPTKSSGSSSSSSSKNQGSPAKKKIICCQGCSGITAAVVHFAETKGVDIITNVIL